MSDTPELYSWRNMIHRCHDPQNNRFYRYGARGISVCPEWRESFQAFLRDMGRRPGPGWTLDRINNDGNYEPGNCRWATRQEQANNTSTTLRIAANGEIHTLTEWCRLTGLSRSALDSRLRSGFTPAEAVTLPRYARRSAR